MTSSTASFSMFATAFPVFLTLFCLLSSDIVLSEIIEHKKSAAVAGKYIRSVTIYIKDIFPEHDSGLYGTANQLKIKTRNNTIRRDLLFKEGDTYDPFLIRESERVLRRLRFLRNVHLKAEIDGDAVDVIVNGQDTWTLIPQLSFSSGDGRQKRSAGIAESNLLGWGKRLELVYSQDESANTVQGVYDDRNLFDSHNQFLLGYFNGNLGERTIFDLGDPFRSLVQDDSWRIQVDANDGLGRLFEAGNESFVYQTQSENVSVYYAIAEGKPEETSHRLFGGFQYISERFDDATAQDLSDLDIDPNSLTLDHSSLASNRRFSGPFLNYQSIEQDFIPMNYIDRFSRLVDYNLGLQASSQVLLAPRALGSENDTIITSGFLAKGWRINTSSFLRGEINGSGRVTSDRLENGIFHGELKYYNLFGPVFWRDIYLGKHTLAMSLQVDHAVNLDLDKQFLLGADNGLRGYDARTFPGDKSFLFNIEERTHLAENVFDLISLGAAVFADVGGSTYNSFGDLITNETYANVGAGLRFAFPRSSGERVFRIDFALPLREGIDGSKEFQLRIIFSGGQAFTSRLQNELRGQQRATVEQAF